MIHPFVGDLTSKTMEELTESINKLTNQQQYMFRLGKHQIVGQISLILSTYRAELQKRQNELWNKKGNSDIYKNVDIS
jgi:hypothetical protein